MNLNDAAALIRDAVGDASGTWADIGAGRGAFTTALASLLAPNSRLYAIDRDPGAVMALEQLTSANGVGIVPLEGDFLRPLQIPFPLSGILLANSLHFAADPGAVLRELTRLLQPGGRVVLVEYDRRSANPWVPYPIPVSALSELAAAAGLGPPIVTARRPSEFGGDLYAAVMTRS
jgi:ubiquinone/menaquinone biosynthesis C-methylase UbiE